jgi:hypothetical protein
MSELKSGRRPPVYRPEWGRITLDAPQYLIDELKIKAVRERTTVRFLFMKALLAQGYDITERDMIEDLRRPKGRKPD